MLILHSAFNLILAALATCDADQHHTRSAHNTGKRVNKNNTSTVQKSAPHKLSATAAPFDSAHFPQQYVLNDTVYYNTIAPTVTDSSDEHDLSSNASKSNRQESNANPLLTETLTIDNSVNRSINLSHSESAVVLTDSLVDDVLTTSTTAPLMAPYASTDKNTSNCNAAALESVPFPSLIPLGLSVTAYLQQYVSLVFLVFTHLNVSGSFCLFPFNSLGWIWSSLDLLLRTRSQ